MTLNFCKFRSLCVFILHVSIGTPFLRTGIKFVYNCFLVLDGLVIVSPKTFCKMELKKRKKPAWAHVYFLSYTFRENFSFLMLQFSIFILHLYILMTWSKEQLNGREKIHFFFFLVEGGKSLFYPSFLDINV